MDFAGKLAALKAKTVERGASPPEAIAAADKVRALEDSEGARLAPVIEILRKLGWGQIQSEAIASLLPSLPPWTHESQWRWALMVDYCSSHNSLDQYALGSQLQFIRYDLCNVLWGIGAAVISATTLDGAKRAFAPYSEKLTKEEMK